MRNMLINFFPPTFNSDCNDGKTWILVVVLAASSDWNQIFCKSYRELWMPQHSPIWLTTSTTRWCSSAREDYIYWPWGHSCFSFLRHWTVTQPYNHQQFHFESTRTLEKRFTDVLHLPIPDEFHFPPTWSTTKTVQLPRYQRRDSWTFAIGKSEPVATPWEISKSLKTAAMRSAGFCKRETAAGKAGGCWKTESLARIFQGTLDRHRRSDLSKIRCENPRPGRFKVSPIRAWFAEKQKSARERTKVVNVVSAASVSVHTSCNVTPVHKRSLITVYIQWNKKKVDPELCRSSSVGSSALFSFFPGIT